MSRNYSASWGAMALSALLACAKSGPSVATGDSLAIRAAVERISAEHIAATTRGDAAGALAMMTDDVVRYEPGSLPQRGRDTAIATLQQYLDSVTSITSETIDYAYASGDLGVAVGSWSEDATVKSNQARSQGSGYWVILMRRQPDGTWKVTHNMSTLSPPAAGR